MTMKMATVEKAAELLEKLRSASWGPAVQGNMLTTVVTVKYSVRFDTHGSFILYKLDMEDLKSFAKSQGAEESGSLTHWDTTFWSERLRESKYDINEVLSPSLTCDTTLLF